MAKNVTYSCDLCGLDNISNTYIHHFNTMDVCSVCCVIKLRQLLSEFHIDPYDWIKDRKKLDNV